MKTSGHCTSEFRALPPLCVRKNFIRSEYVYIKSMNENEYGTHSFIHEIPSCSDFTNTSIWKPIIPDKIKKNFFLETFG